MQQQSQILDQTSIAYDPNMKSLDYNVCFHHAMVQYTRSIFDCFTTNKLTYLQQKISHNHMSESRSDSWS